MKSAYFRWRLAPLLVVVAAGAVFAAKHPVTLVPQVKPAVPVPVLPVQEMLKPAAPTLRVRLKKPVVMETKVTATPFTLTASMESSTAEGQPAILHLALHNSGKERLMIGGSAFEQSAFHFTVTDSADRAVPRTADGERVLTPPMAVSANATVLVGPAQTIDYRFNLARLFDLSRAGVYHVSASRTVAPWAFNLPAPVAGQPAPPKQANLILKPLTFHMTEDTASISSPTALTALPDHQTFLYLASQAGNGGASGVTRWRVGEDGGVSFASSSSPNAPAPTAGSGASSIAATPDGRFLYVGNAGDNTVSQFQIGNDGELSPLSPATVPAQKFPGQLLMDPHGRFLYTLSNWGNTLYAIGSDGRLTLTALMPSEQWQKDRTRNVLPSDFGAIDSAGTFLYACNGTTCGYRLDQGGRVTALPPPIVGVANMNDGRDRAVALSPEGKYAYVLRSTSASKADDLIVPMRVAPDGTLAPILGAAKVPQAPPLPSPGFQPFWSTTLAVDPTGQFLVLVNPGYLDCFRINPNGSLAPLGMMQHNGQMVAILFGQKDHLAYVLNRNPPSLLAFRLDQAQGLAEAGLAMPDGIPFTSGLASAVAPTPEHWGTTSGGLMVSARLSGDVLPDAAPVVLTVTLKNVTSSLLTLGTSGSDMVLFRLSLSGPQRQSPSVLRGGGEPVAASGPLLAAGHDLFDVPGKGGADLVLAPGQQRQYRFLLSRLADLTVGGSYTVQVTRTLPGGARVASPVVPFLLDGPYNGVTRGDLFQGVSVL